jgi:acyl dehydratase
MTTCWPSGPPAIGATAELSRTISLDDIDRFTQISGDRNPLHYDLAAAKASRFGEIVVQGGITSAILNAVVAECLPGPGTVFLNVNWDFTAPVRPGDVITGRVEIIEARTDKPVTKLRTTVTRGDGTIALTGTAVGYTMAIGLGEFDDPGITARNVAPDATPRPFDHVLSACRTRGAAVSHLADRIVVGLLTPDRRTGLAIVLVRTLSRLERRVRRCSRSEHQGLVQGVKQRYSAVQFGNVHQLADLRQGAGHLQAAAVRGSALRRANQGSEPDGVDEANLFQVNHHWGAAGGHLEEALAQWGHGGNVYLPGSGHDYAALFVPDPDGQCVAHGPASHPA